MSINNNILNIRITQVLAAHGRRNEIKTRQWSLVECCGMNKRGFSVVTSSCTLLFSSFLDHSWHDLWQSHDVWSRRCEGLEGSYMVTDAIWLFCITWKKCYIIDKQTYYMVLILDYYSINRECKTLFVTSCKPFRRMKYSYHLLNSKQDFYKIIAKMTVVGASRASQRKNMVGSVARPKPQSTGAQLWKKVGGFLGCVSMKLVFRAATP